MLQLIATLTLAVPARAPEPAAHLIERRVALMGTVCALEVEAADRPSALRASEAAVRALEAVEARLSTWRETSELARLNRAPVGVPFPLSDELARDLRAARRWYLATAGAFDPGVGALVDAWGLREGGRRPEAEALARALSCGGFGALRLEQRAAVRTREHLQIEEGGFGKGAGLDEALAALRALGVERARLDLGGQVAFVDDDERELALADPRDRERAVLRVRVQGGSVATSGNSERGIELDGVRLGHLLDPRSGRPAPDFGSLTVWARDALTADCLSTGLYVLGPDAALRFADEHEGIEVLALLPGDDGLRVRASRGLAGRVTLLTNDVVGLGAPRTPTAANDDSAPPSDESALR